MNFQRLCRRVLFPRVVPLGRVLIPTPTPRAIPSPHDGEVGRGDFKRARQFDGTSPSPRPSPRSCLAGRGSKRLQRWWVYQDAPVSLCAFALLLQLRSASQAQVPVSPGGVTTNNVYPVDLPTALRLANAQNLDIQIAREKLIEAKANHESAVEQFFPWISPGAAYRRHEGRIQAVDGTMLDVDK